MPSITQIPFRLLHQYAVAENVYLSFLWIPFIGIYFFANLNNLAIALFLGPLLVSAIVGNIRYWKSVVLEPATLIVKGRVALCEIVEIKERRALIGGSYIRSIRYRVFVESGEGVQTIYGELSKANLIHLMGNRQVGDIRWACYDPLRPTINILDIFRFRESEVRSRYDGVLA